MAAASPPRASLRGIVESAIDGRTTAALVGSWYRGCAAQRPRTSVPHAIHHRRPDRHPAAPRAGRRHARHADRRAACHAQHRRHRRHPHRLYADAVPGGARPQARDAGSAGLSLSSADVPGGVGGPAHRRFGDRGQRHPSVPVLLPEPGHGGAQRAGDPPCRTCRAATRHRTRRAIAQPQHAAAVRHRGAAGRPTRPTAGNRSAWPRWSRANCSIA